MPDLDDELATARRDLLLQISLPHLDDIRGRSRAIRRRRTVAGIAAACVLLLSAGTALANYTWRTPPNNDIVAAPPDAVTLWRGGAVTVRGLSGDVLDLPGDVHDVQFIDRQQGFALVADCRFGEQRDLCAVRIAMTADGGRRWTSPGWLALAADRIPRAQLPSLRTVGSQVLVISGDGSYVSSRSGGFTQTGSHPAPRESIPAGASAWVSGGTDDCRRAPIEVVLPDGWRAPLANQPAMDVCRVAAQATAGGAWWVSGQVDGRPAVGVSRDAGRSWHVTTLPAARAGAWAQVSTLGGDAFATVVSTRGGDPFPQTLAVHAVYRSTKGAAFAPYLATSAATMIGEVVPLLDGGLLAAGPGWQLSPGAGRDFALIDGSLPWLRSLVTTPGAWVAHDLFRQGWTAISHDGTTWQKINLR